MDPDAERDEQEDAGHELGHNGQREPDDGDRAVGCAAGTQAGDDAPEHAERNAECERDRRKLERAPQRGPEQRAYRHLLRERGAEVPVQDDGARPVQVLDVGRLVGPELLVERGDGALWRERPEDDPPDITGQQLRRREHDDAEQHQRDEREADALEDIAGDGGVLSDARGRCDANRTAPARVS